MRNRGTLVWGISLVPVALIGVTGAIRASQPLLATRRAPSEVRQIAEKYTQVARLLRDGQEREALGTWADLQSSDTPLFVPSDDVAEVGDFSLQLALFNATQAMVERGGQWNNRCLTLAKRLEDTPNQTEDGLELAWRIKRQAIAAQPRTAEAMASESIP